MVLKLNPCVKILKKSSKIGLFSGDQMFLRVSPKLTMRTSASIDILGNSTQ